VIILKFKKNEEVELNAKIYFENILKYLEVKKRYNKLADYCVMIY